MVVQNLPGLDKTWVNIPVDLPTFVFALKACKDAVLTFVAKPGDMEQYAYDIKIGMCNNGIKKYSIVSSKHPWLYSCGTI